MLWSTTESWKKSRRKRCEIQTENLPLVCYDLFQKEELEAERIKAEALEYFKKLDSNGDNLIEVAEIQSRQTFDRDRNGEGRFYGVCFFLMFILLSCFSSISRRGKTVFIQPGVGRSGDVHRENMESDETVCRARGWNVPTANRGRKCA